jgi:hypothetical protein
MITVNLITNDINDGRAINVPCLPPVGSHFNYQGRRYTVVRVLFDVYGVFGGEHCDITLHLEPR